MNRRHEPHGTDDRALRVADVGTILVSHLMGQPRFRYADSRMGNETPTSEAILERVMNSAEKPHRNANISVSSVLRRSPVFRISKPFLSKFITASRGDGAALKGYCDFHHFPNIEVEVQR
jgi:hypothetical protein